MSEIEVRMVDELAIEAPEYVLYGGKGGVGKTTMAAATGLASAVAGEKTLVVSTDPAHSLSDTFELDVPSEPGRIHDEQPLYGVEIDPDAAMEDTPVFDEDGPLGQLGGLLGDEDLQGVGGTMPGADEAAAMQQLLRFLDDDRFDRVVIDTAPTGHTLQLLELPDVMDTMLGRVLSFRERLSGMMDSLTGMFGGEEADPEAGLDDLRTLRTRIERLRSALRDPIRTDFRIVMVPEEMSVLESQRLRTQLEGYEIPVGTVIVNRVMEDLADVADVEADFIAPNLDSCEFCQRRWAVQQDALANAQELFRGHDVKRVPLFADEVRGPAMVRVVAACLS